jgi:hypothetical protein
MHMLKNRTFSNVLHAKKLISLKIYIRNISFTINLNIEGPDITVNLLILEIYTGGGGGGVDLRQYL